MLASATGRSMSQLRNGLTIIETEKPAPPGARSFNRRRLWLIVARQRGDSSTRRSSKRAPRRAQTILSSRSSSPVTAGRPVVLEVSLYPLRNLPIALRAAQIDTPTHADKTIPAIGGAVYRSL